MPLVFLCAASAASAQWLNFKAAGTPRTRDGKANLSAPAPRTANGKPDLSGIWQAEGAPFKELVKYEPGGFNGLGEDVPSQYFFNVLSDFKPEEWPFQPAAAAAYRKQASASQPPMPLCQPPAMPMADALPIPFKIVQTPRLVLVLYEADTFFRQVFMDGRTHPADPQPSWLGYSVGRWEGDALVVETTGFTERSPLDVIGHPHSGELRVTERFNRRNFGHMDVAITIDDPKTYTKSFTYTVSERLLPDTDLIEGFCVEDEKDAAHMAAGH
jgi:hypothetical protein